MSSYFFWLPDSHLLMVKMIKKYSRKFKQESSLFRVRFQSDSYYFALVLIKNEISESCKDLILAMLQYNPNKRITSQQAIEHKWFKEYNNHSDIFTPSDIQRS